MTSLRANLLFAAFSFAVCFSVRAQESVIEIEKLRPDSGAVYNLRDRTVTVTNGAIIKYPGTVLTAETVFANELTGEVVADGQVRIYTNNVVWAGEHIVYNFKTRQMATDEFRTGRSPVFAGGRHLSADLTNRVYNARHAVITTDDVANPAIQIRARRLRITPGQRVQAWDGVLFLGPVPVFYFPYYSRNLGIEANNFNFTPGYRSAYGPFVLGSYTWYVNEHLNTELHMDYREKRGVAGGPDLNYQFGRWGLGTLRYYYAADDDPQVHRFYTSSTDARTNFLTDPVSRDRHRVYFSYLASPFTNFEMRSLVRYQSDGGVVRDFFTGEYRQNPHPSTFFEADKFWQNFSLNVYAQPRVNDFLETVERLPEVRLTGFRQQIGPTPFYYENESSVGDYRRRFAERWTNNAGTLTNIHAGTNNFYALRADTYHQLTLPRTYFGWLTFTPRAGGRFTYYREGDGPAGTNDDIGRAVFNTGAEISFKVSRLWPGARSRLLELDGLRHIIEPSVNYVYVPRPNYRSNEVPQFDYEMPTLRLLPIEYTDYNAIDSIDSQNVVRFGLRNRLQTKRDGLLQDFLEWELATDWRLRPRTNQHTFADLYSDFSLRPRSWLKLESQTRFDFHFSRWRMLLHTVTLEPNTTWSWTVGHLYLRSDLLTAPAKDITGLGEGANVLTSGFFYRLNENWGARATHHYDVEGSQLREQYYTIYRDLRSWTVAVTAGLRNNPVGPKDYSIALTFSLKAVPKYGLGGDSIRPYALLGQ